MSHDTISRWVDKAKADAMAAVPSQAAGVQVIKRLPVQNKGSLIMEVAEKLRPWLINMFDGVRDENGMLLQPSRIRGMALNVAQDIVRNQERPN